MEAALFVLIFWLSLVLLLLAELEEVCPDVTGLEAMLFDDEIVFCVCEMVGLFVVD